MIRMSPQQMLQSSTKRARLSNGVGRTRTWSDVASLLRAVRGWSFDRTGAQRAPNGRPFLGWNTTAKADTDFDRGATGGTGRQLIAQALERGFTVTALVRNPSRLPVDHPCLTVVRGDVLDAPSVQSAMGGQEAVLSALGHKRYFYPTRILSEGTSNILRAMEIHRVRRLVCETSLGIGDSAGRLGLYYTLFVIPLILPFYFWTRRARRGSLRKATWTGLSSGRGRSRMAQTQ